MCPQTKPEIEGVRHWYYEIQSVMYIQWIWLHPRPTMKAQNITLQYNQLKIKILWKSLCTYSLKANKCLWYQASNTAALISLGGTFGSIASTGEYPPSAAWTKNWLFWVCLLLPFPLDVHGEPINLVFTFFSLLPLAAANSDADTMLRLWEVLSSMTPHLGISKSYASLFLLCNTQMLHITANIPKIAFYDIHYYCK